MRLTSVLPGPGSGQSPDRIGWQRKGTRLVVGPPAGSRKESGPPRPCWPGGQQETIAFFGPGRKFGESTKPVKKTKNENVVFSFFGVVRVFRGLSLSL